MQILVELRLNTLRYQVCSAEDIGWSVAVSQEEGGGSDAQEGNHLAEFFPIELGPCALAWDLRLDCHCNCLILIRDIDLSQPTILMANVVFCFFVLWFCKFARHRN